MQSCAVPPGVQVLVIGGVAHNGQVRRSEAQASCWPLLLQVRAQLTPALRCVQLPSVRPPAFPCFKLHPLLASTETLRSIPLPGGLL